MSSAPAHSLEALERVWPPTRPMTLTVRTIDSLEGVERLRPAWGLLQGRDLPADIDYYLTIAHHHREILRPNVVVVEQGDRIVSLVAAYLQRGWIVHRLGPWNPYTPTITALTTAYRGFLGEKTPDVLALSLGELNRSLDRGEADAIHLRYVVPGDSISQVAQGLVGGLRRERHVPVRTHWSMELGSSLDDTLAGFSQTTRESLRRTSRKLERAFSGRLRLEDYRDPRDAERMFADIDMIASRSYQRHGDTVFGPRDLERALVRVGLEKGWYRALVLYLDDTPAAFWTGYAYGGTFGWRGATGYDPMFRDHSPGTFVLLRLIASLAEDPAISTFDLGGGDVDYKRRFADTQWEEVDIRLFGPGVRNLGVNLVGSSLQLMHQGLRATARRFGAHDAPTKLHRNALKQRSVDNTRHRNGS